MSFGFGFGFTKITAAIRAAFSPSSLFAANEPGVWYDPSDFSTMFQDSAGTTPVTAVEQPVGLMLDKSRGLVLGPELMTNGDFSNGTTGWIIDNRGDGAVSVYNGTLTLSSTKNYQTDRAAVYQVLNLSAGTYEISGDVIAKDVSFFWYIIGTIFGASNIGGNAYSPGVGSFRRFITVPTSGNIWFEFRVSGTLTIDNISVRELPGNHAYQTTATSRPVLSARYNLLTKTEQFDDAAWTKVRSNITQNAAVAPDGTFTADKWIEDTTTANNHLIYGTLAAFTTGVSYTMSLYAKAAERSFIQLTTGLAVGGETRRANFNLSNGTIGSFGADATPSITAVGNGWFHCQIVFIPSTTAIENLTAALVTSATAERLEAYTGDGTSGIYIWGASLVPTNQSSLPYQRVNTDTDYDADPAKFPHYLRFDGVDDWLVTNTITPGIDKAQVFAGVRKLSDGGNGAAVVELSASTEEANNGSFLLAAPYSFRVRPYMLQLRGTSLLFTENPSFAGLIAPRTDVLSSSLDIAASAALDEIKVRVSGIPQSLSYGGANAGTGNFGNYPLYIGRRAGTSLPFNGHLYSLIVRFGSNLPITTIENTEKYINTKTRAY